MVATAKATRLNLTFLLPKIELWWACHESACNYHQQIHKNFLFSSVESSSSTRFVKVRFDNKAGAQVKVIPSKGQNKNEGYTVQPHMTLDLNFEEKGQQNDIPIEFKVENPWTPGDKLLVNGQQGPVTVVPSPNKDDIKLVTITAAGKYFASLLSS